MDQKTAPLEEVSITPGTTLATSEIEKQIDDVLPRDLPKDVSSVENTRGIWYVHFIDFALDRDREDPIRAIFRLKREKIAEGELAVLQMQENVDPSLIPSPSVIIGVLTQMIEHFDSEAVAKIWAFSTFSSYYSAHDNSKANLMTATGYLEAAEWAYQLFYLQFKRLARTYKERYGDNMFTLAEIEKKDPALYWHLRDKLSLEKDSENGQVKASERNRLVRWWYERLVKDRGDQAERLYDLVRAVLWTSEGHLNAVFRKSKTYSEGMGGGLGAMEKIAGQVRDERVRRQKATTVQTTVQHP